MKIQTFSEGKFSQIQFEDGVRLFIETGPVGIRIKNMGLLIPKDEIWQHTFPFFIRTQKDSWPLSEAALLTALATIEKCHSFGEFCRLLPKLELNFQEFVQHNFDQAYQDSLKHAGIEKSEEAYKNWESKGYSYRARKSNLFEKFSAQLSKELDKKFKLGDISKTETYILQTCLTAAGIIPEFCKAIKVAEGMDTTLDETKAPEAFLFLYSAEIFIFGRTYLINKRAPACFDTTEKKLFASYMDFISFDDVFALHHVFKLFDAQPTRNWREIQLKEFVRIIGDRQFASMLTTQPSSISAILSTGIEARKEIYAQHTL